MSEIEYKSLKLAISKRLDERNILGDILCLCEGKIASGSEHDIQNAWSLFKKLEEQNNLADRLEDMKELLKGVGEWSLNEKRQEYNRLLKPGFHMIVPIVPVVSKKKNVHATGTIIYGNVTQTIANDPDD